MLVHQEIYIFELEQSFKLVWVASVFHSNPYIKIWMPLKTSKKWHQLLPLASAVQPVHTFIFVHDVKFPACKFCLSIGKWTVGNTAFGLVDRRSALLQKVLSLESSIL